VTVDAPSEPQPLATSDAKMAPVRWAIIGLFLLAIVGAIAIARDFLVPVVLAFLLALVFSPVRRWLERRGVPPALSALGIVLILLMLLLTLVGGLATPISGWLDDAPRYAQEVEYKLRSLFGAAEAVMKAKEQVDQMTAGSGGEQATEVVVRDTGALVNFAFNAPVIAAQAFFVLVLLFLVLASGDMFYEKVVHVMPTFKDKRRAMRIAHDIERKLSQYLFTITIINAGLGVAIGLVMGAIGMPYPVVFALLGFTFNFVPYVGAIAGVFIATVVGLITFDSAFYAFLAGGLYFLLTSAEGQFVTPYFVGRKLRMNVVVVFLAVAFWAWLWSIMGMLLAVPLLVTVRAFCEHIPQLQPLGNFLSPRHEESDVGDEGGEDAAPSPT